jgi:flagellum-specific ATP synthase
MNFKSISDKIDKIDTFEKSGKVKAVKGLIIEAVGIDVFLGEVCKIKLNDGSMIMAEVIGFEHDSVFLMTYEELSGIGPNNLVIPTGKELQIEVSNDMLGHVFNGIGKPISDYQPTMDRKLISTNNQPPNALKRKLITDVMSTGVKAIDAFLTVGVGQRMGIFAGSGVGKSTMIGMVVRNCDADINILALVGERGRELREFIERDLGEEGMKRSIVVVATSDESPLMRIKASFVATSIAEHFRDQGYNVNLFMDSVTRLALAQRELGLSLGEPPTTRGFTPSVFALLPKLLERSGMSDKGAITAFYTVLVEGDDMNEPIVDTVRGILDGHIILSRRLAERNQYPAIDVGLSVSRLFPHITSEQAQALASRFRDLYATYLESEDLISIGAYQPGSNPHLDEAVNLIDSMREYLKQGINAKISYEDAINLLNKLLK